MKILFMVLVLLSPLPKESKKKDFVPPKQVIMVRTVQEASIRVWDLNNGDQKWEPTLYLLDLEKNSLSTLPVPGVEFKLPEAAKSLEKK